MSLSFHFTDEKAEAQRDYGANSRTSNKWPRFEPKKFGYRAATLDSLDGYLNDFFSQ